MRKFSFQLIGFALLFAGATSLNGCTKEGPAGPKGDTGAQGPAGIDGNANVIGTSTLTLSSASSWSLVTASTDPITIWSAGLSASAITQQIVDKGDVRVFMKFPGSNYWNALPYVYLDGSNFNYSFSLGVISILYKDKTANFPNPYNYWGAISFRAVIISPSQKMANKGLDWNDYEQVKQALHLSE